MVYKIKTKPVLYFFSLFVALMLVLLSLLKLMLDFNNETLVILLTLVVIVISYAVASKATTGIITLEVNDGSLSLKWDKRPLLMKHLDTKVKLTDIIGFNYKMNHTTLSDKIEFNLSNGKTIELEVDEFIKGESIIFKLYFDEYKQEKQ